MYPPLFPLKHQVDVPSSWTDPQWDIPSLVLSITTQVDVPSTCATKDVPSNVLGQRILRRLVPWIFVRGNKRYLRRLVLWNLLLKGKGRIKRILRRLVLWILCKGEERHKRIQAVSPSFFWQRKKRTKKMNSTSFWTKNFSWKRKCW